MPLNKLKLSLFAALMVVTLYNSPFQRFLTQNFPANSNGSQGSNGAVYNPNFVRKSVRGSRGSKRKLKATMAALRQQTMEVDGCVVPFIDGIFIRNYPLRTLVNVQEFEVSAILK